MCPTAASPRGIHLWAAFASLIIHASLTMPPAVCGSPASQLLVAEVLLGCCLPAPEAECVALHSSGSQVIPGDLGQSGGDVAHAALLATHSDKPAVAQQALLHALPILLTAGHWPLCGALEEQLASQPSAAQAALHAAARIVPALPERPPPGEHAAADWLRGHQHAAELYCRLLDVQAAPEAQAAQMAQCLELLHLGPHIVAVVRQLYSSRRQPGLPPLAGDLAISACCILLAHAGPQLNALQEGSRPLFTSPVDTICWARAAEAAVRALPLIISLAQQPEEASPAQSVAETLHTCARVMLRDVWADPSYGLRDWAQHLLGCGEPRNPSPTPLAAEDAAEAAAQLWQLHCTSSCALHYLAAGGRLTALGLPGNHNALGTVLASLLNQFMAAHICMQLAWGGSRGVLRGVPVASHTVPLDEHKECASCASLDCICKHLDVIGCG